MVCAHFTDEKVEAQGADMTHQSLRTGVQKLTSPIIPGSLLKMNEGSMPDFGFPVQWEGPVSISVQHPGNWGELWAPSVAPQLQ